MIESFLKDYRLALEKGSAKMAYTCVMLYGSGGVGKTSLLRALKNLPLLPEANSTQLADIYSLKPTINPMASRKDGIYWTDITEDDEFKEIIRLVAFQSSQHEKYDSSDRRTGVLSSDNIPKFNHSGVEEFFEEVRSRAVSLFERETHIEISPEVYMNVWDVGGQSVYLNIIPAFLTSKTFFLSVFDARGDLQDCCRSLANYKNKTTEELEEVTTLQFLLGWMATIHATLFRKKDTFNVSEEHASPKYPRIMPVGTHGDDLSVEGKKHVLDDLLSKCANKEFAHLLLNGVIVDNTTAGKGWSEDSAFQIIREAVSSFSCAIDTPIAWVHFRKVFQRYAKGKPVLPLEEVKELAVACAIPKDAVPSVLKFYHSLSIFFHYLNVPALKSVVIANPQWLIEQMAKLLALKGFEEVQNDTLWKPLREYGVLVQDLYYQVLQRQKELEPQAIIDLLENFSILSPIHTRSKVHTFKGREYFVPSMLPHCMNPSPQVSDVCPNIPPLHLIFSTNYVPPGYFARMATAISLDKHYQIDFDRCLYRNKITFRFGSPTQEIDKLTITKEKSSVKVQIEYRSSSRPEEYPDYLSVCQTAHNNIKESIIKVAEWFPGIDVSVALKCHSDKCQKDDFILLKKVSDLSSNTLVCQNGTSSQLNSREYTWFFLHQVDFIFTSVASN